MTFKDTVALSRDKGGLQLSLLLLKVNLDHLRLDNKGGNKLIKERKRERKNRKKQKGKKEGTIARIKLRTQNKVYKVAFEEHIKTHIFTHTHASKRPKCRVLKTKVYSTKDQTVQKSKVYSAGDQSVQCKRLHYTVQKTKEYSARSTVMMAAPINIQCRKYLLLWCIVYFCTGKFSCFLFILKQNEWYFSINFEEEGEDDGNKYIEKIQISKKDAKKRK